MAQVLSQPLQTGQVPGELGVGGLLLHPIPHVVPPGSPGCYRWAVCVPLSGTAPGSWQAPGPQPHPRGRSLGGSGAARGRWRWPGASPEPVSTARSPRASAPGMVGPPSGTRGGGGPTGGPWRPPGCNHPPTSPPPQKHMRTHMQSCAPAHTCPPSQHRCLLGCVPDLLSCVRMPGCQPRPSRLWLLDG